MSLLQLSDLLVLAIQTVDNLRMEGLLGLDNCISDQPGCALSESYYTEFIDSSLGLVVGIS